MNILGNGHGYAKVPPPFLILMQTQDPDGFGLHLLEDDCVVILQTYISFCSAHAPRESQLTSVLR